MRAACKSRGVGPVCCRMAAQIASTQGERKGAHGEGPGGRPMAAAMGDDAREGGGGGGRYGGERSARSPVGRLPVPVMPAAPLPRFCFIVRRDDRVTRIHLLRTKKKAGQRPAMKVLGEDA